jgi:Cu(I)/Ag(I) efflux system membrane fusion protein
LLEVVKTKQAQPEIYEASKEKLRQLKLTESQISTIENSGIIQSNIEIVSNTSGIVTARRVNNGDYISQGAVLYDIANLSSVWIVFDAYESDLPFLNTGNKISFNLSALPETRFSGNIEFIDPVIDPVTRVSKVRVEIGNQSGKLKPEMFATGIVNANLVEFKNSIIIPQSAVLWTGKRSVVYVQQADTKEPVFKKREIELGPMLGNSYVVINGLSDGEKIVTQGTFSVDAAAQLDGKPSMMNQSNEKVEEIHTIKEIEFRVAGNCEMCKDRIEEAAKSIKGVQTAYWDGDSKILKISYNRTGVKVIDIHKAIAIVGHDTDKAKAPNNVYSKLPECCLYRK